MANSRGDKVETTPPLVQVYSILWAVSSPPGIHWGYDWWSQAQWPPDCPGEP